MEIIVPITISDLQISSNNYTIKDSRYVRAGEFLLNDNYAKARKLYTEIIKTGNAHPIAYYNRGICNFELGKYSECYADMEHVIEADPNNETFEDVFIIQNEAQVKIQELHEKGNETWGNFLLALNGSLYNGIQAYQQSKMMMNRQNTFTPQIGGNLVGGSWNPELAAAGINPPAFISENYLQNQVSMKMQEVEEKVIKDAEYFKRMYRLNHPYADENTVNSAYGNYVNDCANINNGSNIDSSSSSESSPKDSNTSQTKQRYGYKNCHICKGSGICQTCKGHKVVENYGKLSECPNCELENMKRTGKCSRCHGSGQVYGIN